MADRDPNYLRELAAELRDTIDDQSGDADQLEAAADYIDALTVRAEAAEQLLTESPSWAEKMEKRALGLEQQLATAQAENKRLRELLELPALFHAGGPPNTQRWVKITGTREMTNKVMCDTIRAALAGEGE